MHTRFLIGLAILVGLFRAASAESPFPGQRGSQLDSLCWEEIWERDDAAGRNAFLADFVKVPRDQVVAFAIYTHQDATLKMTAQLFPLRPSESREVRLELFRDGQWREIARAAVVYPGWHAHFRIKPWDNSRSVRYRVRHGEQASFEGLVREDPVDKDEIVLGSLSCNSNHDRGGRERIVANLRLQDPDLLFFAGDQSYDHREHTAAWLLWGKQFADVIRDRPVVTIPDDHDIGQANLWGEGGIVAETPQGPSGGYFYPAEYVRMVESAQTWHLPDAADPRPIQQEIGVYFTRLVVGGVDFAIVEDRKFKTGPKGTIPAMGPRPDHIDKPGYDPRRVDLPGLQLLGGRQLRFLHGWGQDWTGAEMKAVLSQTAFAGAVHLHGSTDNRLLADLDSNAWPQSGRNRALRELRRALATHICGDQHLSVVVKHGIDAPRDGPFGFTSPAIVNTIYGRWWWPKDERRGGGQPIDGLLPWTGDYVDGLGNHITMYAYANPTFTSIAEARRMPNDARDRALADGYGLVRFNKAKRTVTLECWPRFADASAGDAGQFPGWPVTFSMSDNDGRRIFDKLPELVFRSIENPVVQVADEAGEILYTVRIQGRRFRPHVYADGKYQVKVGRDRADRLVASELRPGDRRKIEIE